MKIFAMDGLVLGFAGALAGFMIGAGLCVLLKHTSLIELPKEIYYMDRLPVAMNPTDVMWVMFVASGLSFVSSLYPAFVAGRLDPVKALRYE
jgi:lipoprotein-releasing system permease protein